MAEAGAGFWKRYAAWSLDAAILALPVWLLNAERVERDARALLASAATLLDAMAQRMVDAMMEGVRLPALAQQLAADAGIRAGIDGMAMRMLTLVAAPAAWFAAFAAIYWIGFEASSWRATPGKRALGLRVAALDDETLSRPRTVLRHFAGALSWATLNLGHALAAWTPQKRALHDFVAGARVLANDGGPMPVWARLWIAVQFIAALVASAWLYLSLLETMQASLT